MEQKKSEPVQFFPLIAYIIGVDLAKDTDKSVVVNVKHYNFNEPMQVLVPQRGRR